MKKLTKMLALLLVCCMVLGFATAFAEEPENPQPVNDEPVVATTKNVKVIYRDADSKKIGEQTVTVAADATQVIATDLKAPAGYSINYDRIGAITRDNIAYVLVEENCSDFRWIKVNYDSLDGVRVDTDYVRVAYGRTTMSVGPAPKGWTLVDSNNLVVIDDNTREVTVNVMKPVAPQKPVTPNINNKIPKTADESDIALWAVLCLLSASAAAVVIRKKNKG